MAQSYLGDMNVGQNHAEAVRWYRLAAEQGHAGAQISLGLILEGEDDAEAVRWYRLAADQGDAFAQYNLGHTGGGSSATATI